MRVLFIPILALCVLCSSATAATAAAPGPHSDRFRALYEPPKNPAHQALYEELKAAHTLEKFREFLSFIRLPHVLILKLAGCNGEENAWYDPEDLTITVCYEYLAKVRELAPTSPTPDGISASNALQGPLLEVFLHEVGHALFDQLHTPILGQEEDAADQFAAFILLHLGEHTVHDAVIGVAWMYAQEAKDAKISNEDLANVHGLSGQRFYTLLCLAYGAEPKEFADLVSPRYLPTERAEGCADEYGQVAYAIETLLSRNVDIDRRDRVFAKEWLGGALRKKPETLVPPK